MSCSSSLTDTLHPKKNSLAASPRVASSNVLMSLSGYGLTNTKSKSSMPSCIISYDIECKSGLISSLSLKSASN